MNYDREIEQLKEWFLREKNGNEEEFVKYLNYCQKRGMLNESLMKKVSFTKANCEKLLKEFQSPVKRTAKLLGLTYKELAEQIGYTENGLKNAVSKNQITEQLKRILELLQENKELKNKLEIQTKKIIDLKNILNIF